MSRLAADRTRGVLLVASAGIFFSTIGLGVRLMEAANAWQVVFYRAVFQTLAITAYIFHRNGGELLGPLSPRGMGRRGRGPRARRLLQRHDPGR